MANRAGLVCRHEKREDAVTLQIPLESHQRALASGVDVPEGKPSFPLPLSEVGISNKTVWVRLPQGRLAFDLTMCVGLPGSVRGIHMSRMEEVLSELAHKDFVSATGFVEELGRKMLLRQRGATGRITLSGKVPVDCETVVSGGKSHDAQEIDVIAGFHKMNGAITVKTHNGVRVCHMTSCPCTQEYNRAAFNADLGAPQITHSQRSFTRLSIESENGFPSHEDIRACLEAALHVTLDLQKRSDEAEIVMKAHRAPQFAEDAVRETAREAGRRFGDLPDSARVIIESQSLESIHIHDVRCRVETSIGELSILLKQGGHEAAGS